MPLESINPATGERLRSFPAALPAEVDAIVRRAAEVQRAWKTRSVAARAEPMRRVAELLEARAPELARLMALEVGKPLKDGVAEVKKCALVCRHYAEHSERYLASREEKTDATRSFVRFDPLGVVLAIMPWNFPFWQVFRFVAPNLMAGNGGLLKHAANVPQCALAIEDVIVAAGFPKDLFRTLLIESKEVSRVIADPLVAAVTLTGSEQAGRSVGEAAGKHLKPVVLELGGSDPFIVLADADIEAAAKTAATARTINAGQSCIAAKRFIVDAAVYDRFVARFVEAMRALQVGDPLAEATDIGPQARVDLRDALHEQVQQAIAEGARVALGCEVPSGPGAYYPASVLVDVGRENIAAREEIFGPVAAVMKARDADEALAIANDSRFGLGASVWTAKTSVAERFATELEAGSVFVNGMVKSDPRLPFGGVKASGVGRELSQEGMRAFVNVKTVWMK